MSGCSCGSSCGCGSNCTPVKNGRKPQLIESKHLKVGVLLDIPASVVLSNQTATNHELGCGKMYPDLLISEKATATATIIAGVAPVKTYSEGSEMKSEGGQGCKSGNACKCGSNCSCDPCNC